MKRVLVTGTGHSGTTFVARLLMELGCDFGQGDPPAGWTEGRHAMEYPPVARVAQELLEAADGIRHLPEVYPASIANRSLAQRVGSAARGAPPFVKNPAIGYTLRYWITAGLEVDQALICYRDVAAAAHSAYEATQLWNPPVWRVRFYGILGMIWAQIGEAKIPALTLHFPAIARTDSVPKLWDALSRVVPLVAATDLVTFGAAHKKVARPDWIR